MQTQPIFFSVLIPVYNTGKFLEDCIRSIGNDLSFPIEILVTDDGSTDDSAAILERLAAQDPRIRILHHAENKSLYEARRTGVLNSHGQYILFLDSDDTLTENAPSRLFDALKKNPVDVLGFSYRTLPFDTVTAPHVGIGRKQIAALLQAENAAMPTIWNKVYAGEMLRCAYAKLQGGYVNMSEDAVQSIAIALEAKTYAELDGDPIYLYRYDTGISTSGGLTAKKLDAILKSRRTALQLIRQFLAEFVPDMLSNADGMEKNFLQQTVNEQILIQMPDELRDAALLTLPQYFSNKLLEPYVRKMRTEFARLTTENKWFAFAKKADNATNTLFPPGTLRRKIAGISAAVLLFLPKMLFCLLRRVYRIFKPHPDDVRKDLLGKKY